jgi:hypothetical protein
MLSTTATPSVASLLAIAGNVQIESLTISPAAMPHHFVANAKIDDLEPSQMVAAILAVEHAIRADYPRMFRTGWSAKSDGLRIHFHAWTVTGGAR